MEKAVIVRVCAEGSEADFLDVPLPEPLYQRARARARKVHRSFQDIFIMGIEDGLRRGEKELRMSAAGGAR